MKILWTHNFSPDVKNSGVFMHKMANSLQERGMDIDMLYLGNLNSILGIYRAIRLLRSSSISYDLVHSQFGSACGFVSMFAVPKKIISLRGSDWHIYRGNNTKERIHNILSRFLTKISMFKFHHIIVMSNRMKNEVNAVHKNKIISVIADPIDLDLFKPEVDEFTNTDIKKGESKKYVLFNSLDKDNPVKRVSLAKKAIKIAKKVNPHIEIAIASGLDHSEMPSFIASCNLILSTSYYEGWPNCIKESLACGIPFVATDVSDLAEISKRQMSCRVVSPDAHMIAQNIIEVIDLDKDLNLVDEVKHMSFNNTYLKIKETYSRVVNKNDKE